MSDIDKECDFQCCDRSAVRHFWMKHFCNQHNAYLRQKAHRENVQDLDKFIEAHVEGGREAQIDRIIDENRDILDALADESSE